MTSELTKAAQQALEACPFCDGSASFCAAERGFTAYLHAACDQCGARSPSITYSIRHNDIDPETREYLPPQDRMREVARLWNTRALTQRPAAQEVVTDVRTILLDVVPGPDGMGREVYANSVNDVVSKLTELAEQAESLKAELDDMTAARDEALHAPWPEWAEKIKARVRESSGYDGFDDQDGVDLPEEVNEHLCEIERQNERLREQLASLPAPKQATPEPVGERLIALPTAHDVVMGLDDASMVLVLQWGAACRDRGIASRPAPGVPDDVHTGDELPPAGKFVIAWIEGMKVPLRAMWVPDFHLPANEDADPDWAKYSEERDAYFAPAGWYECNHSDETNWQIHERVLAWSHLPVFDRAALAAAQAKGGL